MAFHLSGADNAEALLAREAEDGAFEWEWERRRFFEPSAGLGELVERIEHEPGELAA